MQLLVSAPDSVLVPSSRRDQALTWVLVDRATGWYERVAQAAESR
jgi:hypothetical protein